MKIKELIVIGFFAFSNLLPAVEVPQMPKASVEKKDINFIEEYYATIFRMESSCKLLRYEFDLSEYKQKADELSKLYDAVQKHRDTVDFYESLRNELNYVIGYSFADPETYKKSIQSGSGVAERWSKLNAFIKKMYEKYSKELNPNAGVSLPETLSDQNVISVMNECFEKRATSRNIKFNKGEDVAEKIAKAKTDLNPAIEALIKKVAELAETFQKLNWLVGDIEHVAFKLEMIKFRFKDSGSTGKEAEALALAGLGFTADTWVGIQKNIFREIASNKRISLQGVIRKAVTGQVGSELPERFWDPIFADEPSFLARKVSSYFARSQYENTFVHSFLVAILSKDEEEQSAAKKECLNNLNILDYTLSGNSRDWVEKFIKQALDVQTEDSEDK